MAQEKPIGSNDSQNNKSDWKNSPVLNALCISNDATNRQLRYAAPAIRTKEEGHWILLPMSPDTFVTYLPGRSG